MCAYMHVYLISKKTYTLL